MGYGGFSRRSYSKYDNLSDSCGSHKVSPSKKIYFQNFRDAFSTWCGKPIWQQKKSVDIRTEDDRTRENFPVFGGADGVGRQCHVL
jgi:hypothetical protein